MHDHTVVKVQAATIDSTVVHPEDDEATVFIEHGSRGPAGPAGTNGIGSTIQTFTAPGTLLVYSGRSRFYAPVDMTISAIEVAVGTPSDGQSIVLDINKGGSTIYTTQANRPQLNAGIYHISATLPDITTLDQGEYLTVDIDQVGNVVAGADLTVIIKLDES